MPTEYKGAWLRDILTPMPKSWPLAKASDTLDMTVLSKRLIVIGRTSSNLRTSRTGHINNSADLSAALSRNDQYTDHCIFFFGSPDELVGDEERKSKYQNKFCCFPITKGCPPPLETLYGALQAIAGWLELSAKNVAIIQCTNGLGRSGLVVACFLRFWGFVDDTMAGFEWFLQRRCPTVAERKWFGATVWRYLRYFEDTCALSGKVPSATPIRLHQLVLHTVPDFDGRGGCDPQVEVFRNGELVFGSELQPEGFRLYIDRSIVVYWFDRLLLYQDVVVRVSHSIKGMSTTIVSHAFNTGYMLPGIIRAFPDDLEIPLINVPPPGHNSGSRFHSKFCVDVILAAAEEYYREHRVDYQPLLKKKEPEEGWRRFTSNHVVQPDKVTNSGQLFGKDLMQRISKQVSDDDSLADSWLSSVRKENSSVKQEYEAKIPETIDEDQLYNEPLFGDVLTKQPPRIKISEPKKEGNVPVPMYMDEEEAEHEEKKPRWALSSDEEEAVSQRDLEEATTARPPQRGQPSLQSAKKPYSEPPLDEEGDSEESDHEPGEEEPLIGQRLKKDISNRKFPASDRQKDGLDSFEKPPRSSIPPQKEPQDRRRPQSQQQEEEIDDEAGSGESPSSPSRESVGRQSISEPLDDEETELSDGLIKRKSHKKPELKKSVSDTKKGSVPPQLDERGPLISGKGRKPSGQPLGADELGQSFAQEESDREEESPEVEDMEEMQIDDGSGTTARRGRQIAPKSASKTDSSKPSKQQSMKSKVEPMFMDEDGDIENQIDEDEEPMEETGEAPLQRPAAARQKKSGARDLKPGKGPFEPENDEDMEDVQEPITASQPADRPRRTAAKPPAAKPQAPEEDLDAEFEEPAEETAVLKPKSTRERKKTSSEPEIEEEDIEPEAVRKAPKKPKPFAQPVEEEEEPEESVKKTAKPKQQPMHESEPDEQAPRSSRAPKQMNVNIEPIQQSLVKDDEPAIEEPIAQPPRVETPPPTSPPVLKEEEELKPPAPPRPPPTPPPRAPPPPSPKMTLEDKDRLKVKQGFHWSDIKDKKELHGTVWSDMDDEDKEGVDVRKFEDLFTQDSAKEKRRFQRVAGGASASSPSPSAEPVLIDIRRANNIGIGLSRFYKRFSHKELRESVASHYRGFSIDDLSALKDIMPTAAEENLFQTYDGPVEMLVPAERFLLEVTQEPGITWMTEAMLLEKTFDSDLNHCTEKLETATKLLDKLTQSKTLKRILKYTLELGNLTNYEYGRAISRSKAFGFRVDSLCNLKDVWAVDRESNLVHYLSMLLSRKSPDCLAIAQEFPGLKRARNFECRAFIRTIDALRAQVETVRDGRGAPSSGRVPSFRQSMQPFLVSANRSLSLADSTVSAFNQTWSKALAYFGEKDAQIKPEEMFGYFETFFNDLATANNQLRANQARIAKTGLRSSSSLSSLTE